MITVEMGYAFAAGLACGIGFMFWLAVTYPIPK